MTVIKMPFLASGNILVCVMSAVVKKEKIKISEQMFSYDIFLYVIFT